MSAPFSTAELRRLSDAAPGDKWFADPTPWFGLKWGVRRATAIDGGKALLKCNESTPDQGEHVARLVAYLGTHRETIQSMLSTANILVNMIDSCPLMTADDVHLIRKFAERYKKAREGVK